MAVNMSIAAMYVESHVDKQADILQYRADKYAFDKTLIAANFNSEYVYAHADNSIENSNHRQDALSFAYDVVFCSKGLDHVTTREELVKEFRQLWVCTSDFAVLEYSLADSPISGLTENELIELARQYFVDIEVIMRGAGLILLKLKSEG